MSRLARDYDIYGKKVSESFFKGLPGRGKFMHADIINGCFCEKSLL